MRTITGLMLLLSSGAAAAQDSNDRAPVIQVVGVGTVSTKPDVANIVYWVTGEGRTADEASAALAAKNKAIAGALAALLGRETMLSSGEVSVTEARSPDCQRGGNPQARLSEGPCAVTGYIANLQGNVRTGAVDKAGTAAGLAARLGARDARLQGFQLGDPGEAQRRATAAAIANARVKAEAMAAGAGVRLGDLLALNDQNAGNEIRIVANDVGDLPSPRLGLAPAVEIAVSPRPIETQARIFARYAIAR